MMLSKLLYQVKVLLIFLVILGEGGDAVDIHPHKNSQVILRNIIDNPLEHPWCLAEAERHSDPLEGSKLCMEGSFFNIFVMDSNWVEPTYRVALCKDRTAP